MFILSSNILALISPKLAHSTITIAHIDCTLQTAHATPTHYSTCLLLSDLPFFILLVDTFVQGILFGCTDYMPSRPSPKPFPVILFHSQSQSHLFVICSYSHLQPSALNDKNFLYVSFSCPFGSLVLGQLDRPDVHKKQSWFGELIGSRTAHVVHIVLIHEGDEKCLSSAMFHRV